MKIKATVYTGMTLAVCALVGFDVVSFNLMQALQASLGDYSNFLLIALGIAQVVSVLLLIKPKTSTVATVSEVALLVSSLALVLSGQILFVLGNLVLMLISKLVFAKPEEQLKVAAAIRIEPKAI